MTYGPLWSVMEARDVALIQAAVAARVKSAELKAQGAALVADAVAEALDAGVPRSELAAALGVSIPRIYQLRDGR